MFEIRAENGCPGSAKYVHHLLPSVTRGEKKKERKKKQKERKRDTFKYYFVRKCFVLVYCRVFLLLRARHVSCVSVSSDASDRYFHGFRCSLHLRGI